jgi:hypothetical protein
MTQRPKKTSKPAAALPADYAPLLADIKARVQTARIKAGAGFIMSRRESATRRDRFSENVC